MIHSTLSYLGGNHLIGRLNGLLMSPAKSSPKRQLQNSIKGVTPAKAGVQKFLKRLDSRFRGNDNLVLLQLAKGIEYAIRV